MKNISKILKRFIKVIYIFLLLFGLLFTFWVYTISAPYSYNTYLYNVACNNGKEFDPTSKPTDHSLNEPYLFYEDQLKSECEYGTAYYIELSKDLHKNYDLTYTEHPHVVRTVGDQIRTTLVAFVSYYILLEVVKRILLYIFVGKAFISFKRKG